MLPRDEADQQEVPRAPPCAVPGCDNPDAARALIWGGRRLCYRHFADYDVWSLKHCDSRAPTADEWGSFLRYATGTMEAA